MAEITAAVRGSWNTPLQQEIQSDQECLFVWLHRLWGHLVLNTAPKVSMTLFIH